MRQTENHQIFTPAHIVDLILDTIGYTEDNVMEKTIMEPSFGDGAFLCNIIERIIVYSKKKGFDANCIRTLILSNVYGIEKDPQLYEITINKINDICVANGIGSINMSNNLILGDTTVEYLNYKNKFDFVVGNPPYVRVHHMDSTTRKSISSGKFGSGMKELYVYFYEIGIKMLNKTGKLGFITPNSFMKNTSQKEFRNNLINKNLIAAIYNFASVKVFDNAATYTCVCILDKTKHNFITYEERNLEGIVFETKVETKYLKQYVIDKPWIFIENMDAIYLDSNNTLSSVCNIQYGVCTNADKVYIGKAYKNQEETIAYRGKHSGKNQIVYFNGYPVESKILRRCVKESKCSGIDNTYILFPYVYKDDKCVAIKESVLEKKYPLAYEYLKANKDILMKRDMDPHYLWYEYARTQGLVNMNNKKVIFKHIMKRDDQLVTAFALDEDIVVYSGLYITAADENTLKRVISIIETKEFKQYCCVVGKDMANDYVSVNGKAVQAFQI